MIQTSTIVVLLLAAVILYFIYKLQTTPQVTYTVVTNPEPTYVNWMPWSWGYGMGGWPGSSYVSRPMPHYGPSPRPRPSPPHSPPPHSPPPSPPSGDPGHGPRIPAPPGPGHR